MYIFHKKKSSTTDVWHIPLNSYDESTKNLLVSSYELENIPIINYRFHFTMQKTHLKFIIVFKLFIFKLYYLLTMELKTHRIIDLQALRLKTNKMIDLLSVKWNFHKMINLQSIMLKIQRILQIFEELFEWNSA